MKSMKKGNDLKTACLCSLLCVAVSLMLSCLFGKMIDDGLLSMEILPVAACAITGLSALAGCIVTAMKARKKKLLFALTTSGLYFLLLLLVNRLTMKGELRSLLPSLVCVISAALIGSLIGAGKRSRYAK